MSYFANNSTTPAMVAAGPQTYHNPYYKTQCGCGSSEGNGVNILPTQQRVGRREGFQAGSVTAMAPNGAQVHGVVAGNGVGPLPTQGVLNNVQLMPPQQVLQAGMGAAPMCTLTATAPPAGCCHPAPLHCDCCNGSGYFRASEAYGS